MSTNIPPNRVRRYRLDKGLRQCDLARLAKLHQTEISKIELRERMPGVAKAKRISKVLGVTVDELF